MNARMKKLQASLTRDCAPPLPDSAAVRRRVNAALNADPKERKSYMKQKIRLAAVLAAAAVALCGTALAVSANWDALMEALGVFAPYAQEVEGVSATDNGLRVTVEAALSDNDYTTAYVSVTDLTGDRLDENTTYNGMYTNTPVSYDPETRTALYAVPLRQRDFNADGTVTLEFKRFQPGTQNQYDLGFPQGLLVNRTLDARILEESEIERRQRNDEAPPVVLLPGQTPMPIEGTDLLSVSSAGFDQSGVFHILYETAPGAVLEYTPLFQTAEFDDRDRPSGYCTDNIWFGGGKYLDVSYVAYRDELNDDPALITRENISHLTLDNLGVVLYTAEEIKGGWTLTFTPEFLPERSVSLDDTLSGMRMTRVGLTAISLRLELTSRGGTPSYYPVSVYFADGTRAYLGDRGKITESASEQEMVKVVTEDGQTMYAVLIDPDYDPRALRNYSVTWSFPTPIDPEQVTGFSLGYRMYPFGGDAVSAPYWLDEIPES